MILTSNLPDSLRLRSNNWTLRCYIFIQSVNEIMPCIEPHPTANKNGPKICPKKSGHVTNEKRNNGNVGNHQTISTWTSNRLCKGDSSFINNLIKHINLTGVTNSPIRLVCPVRKLANHCPVTVHPPVCRCTGDGGAFVENKCFSFFTHLPFATQRAMRKRRVKGFSF